MSATAAIPQAVIALRNAENSALNGGPSFYSGKGRDEDDNENSNPITNIQSKVKKKTVGVIVTIALILIGGGTFLGMSNSLLMGAFNTLTEFMTDTGYSTKLDRTSKLLSYNSIKSKLGTSFKNRLAANGITVKSNGYEFKTKAGSTIDVPDADFDTVFKSNVEFRSAVITAQYGRVASFFDKFGITYFRTKILQSRNTWNDFKQTGDAEVDNTNFRNDMTTRFDGSTNIKTQGGTEVTKEVYDGVDGDGNPVTHPETSTEISTKSTTTTKSDFATAAAKAGEWLDGISSKTQAGKDILCGLMRVVNSVAAAIAAMEVTYSIMYFMGFAEPTSKTMYGLGTESPIHAVLNFLSTSVTTTAEDYNNIISDGINPTDLSGTIEVGERQVTGSPLESNGGQMILGGAPGNKTEAKNYSLERIGNTVMSILAFGATSFTTCAVVNISTGVIAIGAAILTAGASLAISSFWSFALSAAISIALPLILKFAVPAIAKALFTNIFETAVGKEAGEYIFRGAARLIFDKNRLTGLSYSSKEAVVAYNQYSQEILALEAEADRYNRSPFDITSKNTFLGSIAYSLIPVLTSSKVTSISSFIRTTKNSIASLISPVHADGENSNYITTFGDCEGSATIGSAGDIYCNGTPTSDPSTADLDPNDPTYKAMIDSNMDCDENGCVLHRDSNLRKFFIACSNSQAQPGVIDQSVLSEFEGTGNETLDTILNIVPGTGEIMDVVDGISNLTNMDWASKTLCTNHKGDNKPEYYADPSNMNFWEEEGKFYQRYIIDTSIEAELGTLEEGNPIINLMEELEEKYKNETYTERLARQSGLNVGDVEGIIALAEVYQFTNNYDPSVRIAFEDIVTNKSGEEVVAKIESSKIFFKDNDMVNDKSEPIVDNKSYIAYFNLRDRNYIV